MSGAGSPMKVLWLLVLTVPLVGCMGKAFDRVTLLSVLPFLLVLVILFLLNRNRSEEEPWEEEHYPDREEEEENEDHHLM